MIFVNIKNRLDLFDFICELIYQEWRQYYNIININSSNELITFYKNVFLDKNNTNQKYNSIFLLFNKINSINTFKYNIHQKPFLHDVEDKQYINNFIFYHKSQIKNFKYFLLKSPIFPIITGSDA